MKVLLTVAARSNWGLVNSMWANIVCHDYVPDKVYVIGTEADMRSVKNVDIVLPLLLKAYGSSCVIEHVLVKDDIRDMASTIGRIAEREKKDGNIIALDVTPGRKQYLLAAILAGWNRKVFDHLFYLSLDSLKNAKRPFILIPLSVQRSKDLLKEGP